MYHYSWVQSTGLVEVLTHAGLMNEDQAITWLNAWVVCFTLLIMSLMARLGLNRARSRGGTLQFNADATMTMRNFWELMTGALYGLTRDILGKKDAMAFFWISGGLFIYILTANFLGLVPGNLPPTNNMNHNFAMAFVVLVLFNGAGLWRNGFGYVKHLFGPVWWLSPLIFFIEFISLLVVRPYSLSLRLMGNMFGDHIVFGIMSDLTGLAIGLPLILPAIFLALGIFVSFIQAFVFTLLSTIYIALAVAHEDDH